MRHRKRRAYSLIYMLAALPLGLAVGTMATQLANSALRLQRLGIQQAANADAVDRMLAQLREDARAASGAAASADADGAALSLDGAGGTIVYRFRSGVVTRSLDVDGEIEASGAWTFHHADVTFAVEAIPAGRPVVWARFELTEEWKPGMKRSRLLAAAASVGAEGER